MALEMDKETVFFTFWDLQFSSILLFLPLMVQIITH
jgi:hypothetical protein